MYVAAVCYRCLWQRRFLQSSLPKRSRCYRCYRCYRCTAATAATAATEGLPLQLLLLLMLLRLRLRLRLRLLHHRPAHVVARRQEEL